MVQKRTSRYASMTASELARVTRERGLSKPDGMLNISEWADFLEAEDAKGTEPKAHEVATTEESIADNSEAPDFDAMHVPELQAYAEEHEIDLGTATKKADIIAAIQDAGAKG